MKERCPDVHVHHESGFVGQRVYGGSTRAALLLVPALARGDETGESEATERNCTFAHATQQVERRGFVATPDAAGDGGVPGRRGALRHCVEQVERGIW